MECQELLGEVIAERTRLNESVEDVGQESLNKLPPDTTENFANEPAVEAVREICMRDTASIDVLTKKNPEYGVVAANDELARLKLDSSSDNGSEQINEFSSLEMNTKSHTKL